MCTVQEYLLYVQYDTLYVTTSDTKYKVGDLKFCFCLQTQTRQACPYTLPKAAAGKFTPSDWI